MPPYAQPAEFKRRRLPQYHSPTFGYSCADCKKKSIRNTMIPDFMGGLPFLLDAQSMRIYFASPRRAGALAPAFTPNIAIG